MEEARGPMGLRKDLHIAALTQEPEIRERWRKVKDDYPTQDDVDTCSATLCRCNWTVSDGIQICCLVLQKQLKK